MKEGVNAYCTTTSCAVSVGPALCSALTYTAYILGAERVMARTEPLTSSLWVSAAAAAGLAIAAVASGTLKVPTHADDWLVIAGMRRSFL